MTSMKPTFNQMKNYTHTTTTARLFRRAITTLLLAFGLLSALPGHAIAPPAPPVGITVVPPTTTTAGSITIHNDIRFNITTTGIVQGLALDEWVISDGTLTNISVSGSVNFSNAGAANAPLGIFGFYDNLASSATNDLGANDGWMLFSSQKAVVAGTSFIIRSGSYVLPAVGSAPFFNPQGARNFSGPMFLTTGQGVRMSSNGTASAPAATPIITTPTSASVLATTATLGGNVTSDNGSLINERGVVYSRTSLNPDPFISGNNVTKVTTTGTTGVFTVPVTGLTASSGYTFKAYAINSDGIAYTSVATFTTSLGSTAVTTTANSGDGSLRQAMLNANANPGADAITFDPIVFATAQTVTLTGVFSTLPELTGDTTITGPAAGVNVLSPNADPDVFQVNGSANVSFINLTITNGYNGVSNFGSGTVTISNCVFSATTAYGIFNGSAGTLVVNDSTIRSVEALGTVGIATVTGCTVIAGGGEEMLYIADTGTLTLINCTVFDGTGTPMFANQGTVTAINCTLIETAQSIEQNDLTLKNSIYRRNFIPVAFTDGGGNRVMNSTGTHPATLFADLTALGLDPTGLQNNGGPTLTIALLSGPARNGGLAANLPGGLTTDQRGSGFPRSIGTVDSGAFEAAAPAGPTVGVTTGGAVPGAPAGTTFAGSTGLPGANEGDIGATNIKLPNGKTVKALVNSSGIIIKVGDLLAGAGGAEIAKLDSMSFGVFQAELKVGTGTPAATLATNKVVCFENGSGIQVLARSGQAAPGGSTFKLFRGSCGDAAGNVFIAAILNDGTSVDGGLWSIPTGGALTLLVKEGQTLDLGNGPKRVNAISSFPTGLKSQAEGRVHYGSGSIITRLTLGADHAIAAIPASGGAWTIIARTGGDAPAPLGKYQTLGLPAAEGTNVVFTAVLKTGGAVTTANNKIVVADGAVIARKGDAAPGTSWTFTAFEDVAAGSAGQASFTANISGATAATDSGLWEYRSSALSLVARQGDAAPDLSGVTIASISRFAHPGGGLGPVFVATLGGATATTNVALFGVPATGGSALNLARTGDLFDIGGTMRPLTAISALKMDAGNEGVARGYTDTSVFMIGSFGATRSALIEFPVAP